ncbi:aminotransferase [Podospora fimiseda]|uniref:Aminotransferase n=1 Tax=Podospora fimiseda TaxID=252190 RepID=A0AAN7BU34_9PEZI|nr:aminotransferase [Podospora fimiseda]
MTTPPDFQIFTTLRYDPILLTIPSSSSYTHAGWNYTTPSPFYILPHHIDRLLNAATHFNLHNLPIITSPEALTILSQTILSQIPDPSSPARVRISISSSGPLAITTAKIPSTPLTNLFPKFLPPPPPDGSGRSSEKEEIFQVYIDSERINPSEYTHFKTTKREIYDAARKRKGISLTDKKEVLIIDERGGGEVMEASITTPYFWRKGKWVTPRVTEKGDGGSWEGGQDGTSRRWALESGIVSEDKILVDSLKDGEECWLSNGARGFFLGKVIQG